MNAHTLCGNAPFKETNLENAGTVNALSCSPFLKDKNGKWVFAGDRRQDFSVLGKDDVIVSPSGKVDFVLPCGITFDGPPAVTCCFKKCGILDSVAYAGMINGIPAKVERCVVEHSDHPEWMR